MSTDKEKALDAALQQIERTFGKGSIMRLGQSEAIEIESIPTGSIGLDIALECAKLDQSIKYKLVGSGKRSNLLKEKVEELNLKNVEIIPFLNKEDLYKEYQECMCLLLPSRRECWGLVINEASSFGCPIISTKECGAAIEFLDEEFLANTNDPNDLYKRIDLLNKIKDIDLFKRKLIDKSKKYTIEESIEKTIDVINL